MSHLRENPHRTSLQNNNNNSSSGDHSKAHPLIPKRICNKIIFTEDMLIDRSAAEVIAPVDRTEKDCETKFGSNKPISLLDLAFYSMGAKKDRGTVDREESKGHALALLSSDLQQVTASAHAIVDDPTIPEIRALRTVRSEPSDSIILGTDSKTVSEILLPNLDTNFLLCPFEKGEERTRAKREDPTCGPRCSNVESSSESGSELPSQNQEAQACVPSSLDHKNSTESQILASNEHLNTTMSSSKQQGSQLQRQNTDSPRPRSRAIAIKSQERCAAELAMSQSEVSSEKMYDWATWRMYNRIVDHRRNQRFTSPEFTSLPVEQPQAYNHSQVSTSNILSPDYIYDGEVFELDI